MGDYPIQKDQSLLDCSRTLISKALENVELQNEIYCQLTKQLHQNPGAASVKSGWWLLELISQYFPPSKDLLPVINAWLKFKSEQSPLLKKQIGCIEKNLKTLETGGQRKLVPTAEEIIFQEVLVFLYMIHNHIFRSGAHYR